ncbi:MAG TPA: alpha/beta hydrolase [Pyrinomonadaceae bacterium]|jgi:pimeloyl-ACP methyl ester carboxylesterase
MKKRYWIAGAAGLAGAAVAIKLLSRPRDVVWDEQRAGLAHAERSRFAEIDGARVHYQEAGPLDAPVILLIHGFSAFNLVWSEVLLPIAGAGFRVVAPDLLGHGFSDKPKDGEYTIEAQARMITRLMDELGVGRATLVGNSYGGAVAAACALDYPERVERLVLVGAVINDEAKNQPMLRLARAPLVGNVIAPLLMDSRWVVRRRLTKIHSDFARSLFDDKRLESRHLPLKAASTQRAILHSLRRWKAERIARDAHLIRQPTLLIWGEQDTDTPLRLGEHLRGVMRDARLVVFRRCGHLPQEEYPQEFTELVTSFCGASHEADKALVESAAQFL